MSISKREISQKVPKSSNPSEYKKNLDFFIFAINFFLNQSSTKSTTMFMLL